MSANWLVRKRRGAVSLAALVAVAGTLAACGSSDSGSATSSTASSASTASSTTAATTKDVGLLNDYVVPDIPKAKRPYKVSLLQAHQADAFSVSTTEEAIKFGKEHGLDVTMLDAGGYTNVQKQIAQIQSAVTNKADAIWIFATDPDAVVPALNKAKEAGIKVVNFVVGTSQPYDGTVGGDYKDDGYTMAKALFNKIGGKGDVISILGGAGSAYARDLHAGLEKALKEFPDIKVVSDQTIPDFDPSKVQNNVQNQVTAHPNIKGVFTATSGMAVGAYTGSEAAGGNVTPVGEIIQGCEQLDLLKAGKLPIILGVPAIYYTRMLVAKTVNLLNGDPTEKETIIPGNVYTPENLAKAPLDLEISPHFVKDCT